LAIRATAKPFIDYISQNIVSCLSNRDLEQFDEKYLKIILLNNLFYGRYYIPLSETEVSTGYTDIYLLRTQVFPNMPCEWVFEENTSKKPIKTTMPYCNRSTTTPPGSWKNIVPHTCSATAPT
jgi:hypothetical protein